MSRGINKVILIGNLGSDPEIRYTPSGTAITNLRLATSEAWKDKTTGVHQEKPQWHTVVLFNKLAEIAAQLLKKGSKTYIEGSLRNKKWQDKEGIDRYSTEILATEFQMLESKNFSQNNISNNLQPCNDIDYKSAKNSDINELYEDDIPF